MIEIKGSTVTIFTGPLDTVRGFHAVAKHRGDSGLCLLLPSGPKAADLLWEPLLLCFPAGCRDSFVSGTISPGGFPFCRVPSLSLLLMLVALSSMLSHLHFELPYQSIEHPIFHSLHRSNYNTKTFAEWAKAGCDAWEVGSGVSFCFPFLTMNKNSPSSVTTIAKQTQVSGKDSRRQEKMKLIWCT